MNPESNLPIEFLRGEAKLNEFLSAHPGLEAGIQRVDVEDGHVTAYWGWRNTYQQQQAVALAHRGLVWKRQMARSGSSFDWYAKEGEVTIVLPRSEPVVLHYGAAVVDLDKLEPALPEPEVEAVWRA